MPTVRTSLLVAVVIAYLLALTGCGSDGSATPTASGTQAAPASAGAASGPSLASASAGAAVDQEIVVTVTEQKVTPPTSRVEVRAGATVRITVTSDVADDLHVHGYDVSKALPAGQPASLDLRADRTGLFDVETHHSHLVLFQLQVR